MKNTSLHLTIALLALIFLGGSERSLAQLGNDNPTGASGQFNGNVTTGGSYDPYTGNATRSVTDLVVAGGVSSYPLAFGRTHNTRYSPDSYGSPFGTAGNWRHSYQWTIDPITIRRVGATSMPDSYFLNYPDGRRIVFNSASPYFKATAGGLGDRFQAPSHATWTADDCYLLLADGGLIWFQVQIDRVRNGGSAYWTSTFSFSFMGMRDPEGRWTMVSYPADGSMTITEPAGRNLKIFYGNGPGGSVVIDHVTASDGRSVQYYYNPYTTSGGMYPFLNLVVYFNDPSLVSIYSYQNGNVDPDGRPLLRWALDCMYSGPMWSIGYTYVPGSSGGVTGQIQSENYVEPSNAVMGDAVSTLTVSGNSRIETRGDGPARTFNYSGGRLSSYTDFKNVSSSQTYDANGFVNSTTDRRGITTNMQVEGMTGKVTLLTHPLTGFDGGLRPTVQTVYGSASCPDPNNRDGNNPCYPYSIKNERGHITTFLRDANKQVTQINYPNGAYETFSYNGFGQVLSHRMTSGGVENFNYDGRGLLQNATNLDGTTYFYYDGYDRLEHVTDPRGNSTWYQYNLRGQVTRVTHMDQSYVQIGYDNHGDKISVRDELNHTTSYGYDYFKRVVSVTNPLNQTATFNYARDFVNGYLHTSSNLKGMWSPMGKATHFLCDENWQRTIQRDAAGSADDAWTYYGYDAAGNLASVQDPKGNITTFLSDERNRRYLKIDPAPFNNQTTMWSYDGASNLTAETRPDGINRTLYYDVMNRVTETYGFGGEWTGYGRDLSGNVVDTVDSKGAHYYASYDALSRKTTATYPPDIASVARVETWHYDAAGNMDQYTNPAGQIKSITYDNRNRPDISSWSANGPTIDTDYDAADRLTRVATTNNETIVTFGYDDANRQTYEEQTLAGYPPRRVETNRDADGYRDHLQGTNGGSLYYYIKYQYTDRGQLAAIKDYPGTTPFITFSYDASGNRTEMRDVYNGVNDATKCPSERYDALNRPTMWENTGSGDNAFARSWYQYDNLNRQTATWRDEQAAKGERYGYDAIGQLTSVKYNADQVWTGTPLNPTRSVSYNLDPLNRTGPSGVNENGSGTTFTANAMNQYTWFGTQTPNYTANFNLFWMNGFEYNYDASNQLTSLTGRAQFTYDGLGRCVKRTIDGVTTLFTYDGWKPIAEWKADGNLAALNVYGAGADEILYRYNASNAQRLRYHLDAHGNVAFLLDWSGNGLERYTYDAFGQPTVTNWDGSGARSYSLYDNRFMFTGREWLWQLGLYDYRNRFYQPQLGRFLQPDPTGFAAGDMNLFRYCGGDPVNRIDPSGLAGTTVIYRPINGIGSEVSVEVYGDAVDIANFGTGSPFFSNDARDWGSLGEVMHYLGGGDHGGFNGSDGGGGFGIGTGVTTPSPTLGVLSSLPPVPHFAPVFDQRTERNIATLNPLVQQLAREHVFQVQQAGLDMRIINGSRSFTEQNALYAQGRTAPGPIVTNARGGESNHNFGTAYDVGFFNGGHIHHRWSAV